MRRSQNAIHEASSDAHHDNQTTVGDLWTRFRDWFNIGERLNGLYRTLIGSVFAVWWTSVWWKLAANDDFTSLFIGARVLKDGHPGALYTSVPTDFATVDNPYWTKALIDENFSGVFWHPYVHLPLFAKILGPVTDWMDFPTASRWLVVLNSIAVVVIVWAVGKLFWKTLLQPPVFAGALLILASTQPLRKGMELGQTSPLIIAAVLLALVLAVKHPWGSGILLAVATAIKLTPVLIVIFLLARRKTRKAGLGAVGVGALLGISSILTTGLKLNQEWLDVALKTGSQGLTLAMNQSPVGAMLASGMSGIGAARVAPMTIPSWVAAAALILTIAFVAASCAVVWWLPDSQRDPLILALLLTLPLGLMRISWTHYYIVIIVAVALIGAYSQALASPVARGWLALSGLIVVLLNTEPWAWNSVFPSLANSTAYRGGAWSALLASIFLMIGAVTVALNHSQQRLSVLTGFTSEPAIVLPEQ